MTTHTQVAIIGAGPSGLLLSQILHLNGIGSIVLERKSRAYVEGRVRAGIMEQGAVEMMRRAGAAERLDRECLTHDGIEIALEGRRQRVSFLDLVGTPVTVYGQSEMTKDLANARLAAGGDIRYQAEDVRLEGLDGGRPRIHYVEAGAQREITADFVAGCDGFHGISRQSIPADKLRSFERIYPFAWLGIMAEVPPPSDELIYARHERGFALCSMRSRSRSRHYLQVSPDEDLGAWPEQRIWSEIAIRIGDPDFGVLKTGPLIEKSLTPMRSFVCETMRFGRLFLVGDAAHIVPPTGAKGLNLAAGDVHYLSEGLIDHYAKGRGDTLDRYAERALARVWKAQRFSWWMTCLLHNFAASEGFQNRIHRAELEYTLSSRAAQTALAENYVGLPY